MQELFNITDKLNEFWMLEAKVSTTLEKVQAIRQDNQPVLSATVPYTTAQVPAVRQDHQPVLSITVPYTTCTGTRS